MSPKVAVIFPGRVVVEEVLAEVLMGVTASTLVLGLADSTGPSSAATSALVAMLGLVPHATSPTPRLNTALQ